LKTLFLVLAVVVGLLLAHNYIQTGELGFGNSMSETEREIKRLEDRLADVWRSYQVAGRGTAIGGLDGSSAAESALANLRVVERQLQEVKPQVTTAPERARMEALEQKLKDVKEEMGVR